MAAPSNIVAGTSLSDILTAIKNLTVATNAVADATNAGVPHFTSGQMAANTLVQAGFVRVVGISITTAGAAGTLHDASTVVLAGAGNVVGVVPTTAGFLAVNMVFGVGLVYKPGAAQVATIFYSRT